MTLNPKRLPPWLRKNKPQDQGNQPAETPPQGEEESVELPPWLRDDLPPPVPKVRRVAPQNPEQADGVPPWLAGEDEPAGPKSYKIGGTELSEEYLAAGDELPDTLDSEMTFDSWMADQLESKRVKDIEEEIPDLFSDIEDFEGEQPAVPEGNSTGQLPDWFFGLEALDTSDAPEWFVAEDPQDAQSEPATEIPPWISDLVIEEDEAPQAEPTPEPDDFGSLLRSMGDLATGDYEDEAPQIDWSTGMPAEEDEGEPITDDFFARLTAISSDDDIDEAPAPARPPSSDEDEAEDEAPSFEELFAQLGTGSDEAELPPDNLLGDDLFAGLGSAELEPPASGDAEAVVDDFFAELGEAETSSPAQDWQHPTPPPDEFAAFDDFPDDEPDTSDVVEIPQNELDAFFDNLSAGRSSGSIEDIAEPDLEWIVGEQPDVDEPDMEIEVEDEPPAPMPPVEREDTMSWLSEVSNIVTSVTRPLDEPPEEEPIFYDTGALRNDLPELSESRSDVEEYEWPEPPTAPEPEPEFAPEPTPEPEDEGEAAWLDAITVDDLEQLDLPPAEDQPALPRRSLLSERLRRAEQEGSKPPGDDDDDEEHIFMLLSGDPEQDALIPEDELRSGWMSDDLLSDDDLDTAAPADAQPYYAEQSYADAADAYEDGAAEISAEEDYEDEIDFFTLLESNADANVLLRTGQLRSQEEVMPPEPPADELPADDLPEMPDLDEPDSASSAEDDFYRSFGMQDDDEGGDPKPGGVSDDHFYASFNTGGMDDDYQEDDDNSLGGWGARKEASGDDDDFFASLGFDADDTPSEPNSAADAADVWNDQPDSASAVDDLFASLDDDAGDNPPDDDAESYAWMNDFEEQAKEEDHLNELLGMIDANETQPTEISDDELFAALGISEAAGEQRAPADEIPEWASAAEDAATTDDREEATQPTYATDEELLAALGIERDAPTPAPAGNDAFDTVLGMLDARESQPSDVSDEELFAALGISDDLDEQPVEAVSARWETQPDDEFPQDEDLLAAFGSGDQAEEPAAATDDDIFGDWDAAIDDHMPAARQEMSQDDLFAQWATEAEMPPADDFFAALGMMGDQQPETETPAEPEPTGEWLAPEEPPEEEFFAALGMIDDKPPIEPSAPGFTDIDSYLASLPSNEPDIAQEAGAAFQSPVDFDIDAILSGSVFEDVRQSQASTGDLAPGINDDWLAQVQANVGEVSASAIVRQKEDRPVEELPSRLQKLRRRSEEIPNEPAPDDSLTEVIPGVPSSLTPAPFVGGTLGLVQDISLTPEQQAKADLLRALVPVDDAPQPFRLSAIEATYDSPFMADLEDTPEAILQPVKTDESRRRKRRQRQPRQSMRIDRFLIALLLAAALIAPFFSALFRVGNLPPSQFTAGSPAQQVFDALDSIPASSLVLVGVEYSPASAAELDGMTDALVRHILMRAAYPVIISSNPLGLLRSENLIATINDDPDFLTRIGATEPLQANNDYFIVRYLPGSVIGLRAFSQDTASLLLNDIRGQASKLVVRSMREFERVVLITDRAEDVRAYAEQIAPLTDAPMVSAVSYGAAPLAEPYARALDAGLLVGLGDAYTYASMLGLATTNDLAQRVRIVPTNTPIPTQQPTVPAAETLLPSATPLLPSATPEPLTATVVSRQAVNMRIGPGTDNAVLTAVPSGATVLVLGFNDDRSWVNVQIDDGRQGWISASLLEIRQGGAPASKRGRVPPRRQDIDEGADVTSTPRPPTATLIPRTPTDLPVEFTEEATATPIPPTITPRPSRTPTATPTVEETDEATPEATSEAAAPSGAETGYRDERWYAMNMGIIASALIITFGAVVNVARGLLRRGRRR